MRKEPSVTLSERATSACFGAVFGAIIGAVLVWLFGVYSQTMGSGRFISDPFHWIVFTSVILAACGFIMGSHIGTLIGGILSGLIEFERQDREIEVPTWLAVVFLACVAIAAIWWFG